MKFTSFITFLAVFLRLTPINDQTWKKLIFVRKSIFGVKKCVLIPIDPKNIKVPNNSIIFLQKWLIVDRNADSWALLGKYCKKIVVDPKMSTIFSKTVCKQCLHACDFFHVCNNLNPFFPLFWLFWQYVYLILPNQLSPSCQLQSSWLILHFIPPPSASRF